MAATAMTALRPPFEVVLDNGAAVRIRPIEASDREGLLAAFERLSARSRQLRFMIGKGGLSEEEIRFYTEPDGDHHYAIGAVVLDGGAEREGVGSARFVRLEDDSATAEAAVTVVDAWQRVGLGSLLLRTLAESARARSVRRIRVRMRAENLGARRLLSRVLGPGDLRREDDVVVGVFDIRRPPPGAHRQGGPWRR